MITKTYFSNRIYKNRLSTEYVDGIARALLVFNRAKQFSFSTPVKEKRSGKSRRNKSMHLTVKELFRLDDYYANSAVQEANALQKSLTELNKMYITNMEDCLKQEVSTIIIAHKDRFIRFGFEWFERLLKRNNTEIIIVNNEKLSPQEELIQDLISIIHVFSCRIYGLRKYKKKIKEDDGL